MTATLAQIIRQVESSGGKDLIRYEPACHEAFLENRAKGIYCADPEGVLKAIIAANGCNMATAMVLASTSWGDYQDMGFEIWGELDPEISLKEWLGSDDIQDSAFSRWCLNHGFNAIGPLPVDSECERFARLYNGPGNVAGYVAMMHKAAGEIL